MGIFNRYGDDYPQTEAKSLVAQSTAPITYRRNLELAAAEMEKRAADLRKVIAYFDQNKELEEVLDAMRRLGV